MIETESCDQFLQLVISPGLTHKVALSETIEKLGTSQTVELTEGNLELKIDQP